MKRVGSLPKKAKRKVLKRERTVKSTHPLTPQVKALVAPFNVMPGVAHHLVESLPSQKMTFRSRTTVSVPSSSCVIGGLSPYAYTDTDIFSGFYVTSGGDGSSGSVWLEQIFDNTDAGTNPGPLTAVTGSLVPIRPYTATRDSTARLVSYGFRVRYTGTALNANGSFKVLAAPHGELGTLKGATYREVIDYIQGSHSTQIKSIYDKAVYEFNFVGNPTWDATGTGADLDEVAPLRRLGQASSDKLMSEWGAAFFYANNSSAAIQFELELIEHWEMRSPGIAMFYTDSHTNPELHHEVFNVLNTAHVRAGLQSEKKFSAVISDVVKTSKSPLGKAVIAAALA